MKFSTMINQQLCELLLVCVLHVHAETFYTFILYTYILLCHSPYDNKATTHPSKNCSEATAEQLPQTKSESETKPGTP